MPFNKAMLEGKQIMVCGQRGSGKTMWAKRITKDLFPRHLVFDTIFSVNEVDWKGFNRFCVEEPLSGEELKKEFDDFFNDLNKENIKGRIHLIKNDKVIDLIDIDEVNMVAPSRETPPFSFKFLTNIGRHINLTVIMITRRPVQVNTDAVELADFLVLFSLSGKNDIDFLNNIKTGLGDAVSELDIDMHNFIIWKRGAPTWSTFSKIDIKGIV